MFKIDLHTHSTGSVDGGISAAQYAQAIENGTLDFIAVTDHDSITHAVQLKKTLGEHIIVGEEISTREGEIIGLFLKEAIPSGLSALEVVQAIHKQDGLVYVPHPFETVRHGVSATVLEHIMEEVDIIEIYNGRAIFQNKGPQATTVARLNNKPGAASSDAHGAKGLGCAYSQLKHKPTSKNLVDELQTAHLMMRHPPLKTLLYPKINRFRKRFVS